MITISYIGIGLMGLGGGFLLGLTVTCLVFNAWMRKSGLTLFPDGDIVSNAELARVIEESTERVIFYGEQLEAEKQNNGHHAP